MNLILKNSGDKTAFLLNGFIVSTGTETVTNCNDIGMQYALSLADWTYDVDINEAQARFVGRHSIAPNEVVNFDVMVGRKTGGHEVTVYRVFVRLEFDEGEALETDEFHLQLSGPTVSNGGFQGSGPSSKEWGRCTVDNIRRLDSIGYDFRPFIHEDSAKYVEAASPGIMSRKPGSGD